MSITLDPRFKAEAAEYRAVLEPFSQTNPAGRAITTPRAALSARAFSQTRSTAVPVIAAGQQNGQKSKR